MGIERFVLGADQEDIACTEVSSTVRRTRALVMHGAGEGNQERYLTFAQHLAAAGVVVHMFDFSGHGRSSGKRAELSLSRRLRQAEAVLDFVNADQAPITVIGFSMSGQTVCDLAASGRHAIAAMVLGCPAVYTPHAWDLPFGQSGFTAALRREGSWKESTAFATLASFTGPIAVLRPRVDAVIPIEVTEAILRHCPPGQTEDIVVDAATHKMYEWMAQYADQAESVAKQIANLPGDAARH